MTTLASGLVEARKLLGWTIPKVLPTHYRDVRSDKRGLKIVQDNLSLGLQLYNHKALISYQSVRILTLCSGNSNSSHLYPGDKLTTSVPGYLLFSSPSFLLNFIYEDWGGAGVNHGTNQQGSQKTTSGSQFSPPPMRSENRTQPVGLTQGVFLPT